VHKLLAFVELVMFSGSNMEISFIISRNEILEESDRQAIKARYCPAAENQARLRQDIFQSLREFPSNKFSLSHSAVLCWLTGCEMSITLELIKRQLALNSFNWQAKCLKCINY